MLSGVVRYFCVVCFVVFSRGILGNYIEFCRSCVCGMYMPFVSFLGGRRLSATSVDCGFFGLFVHGASYACVVG